MPRTEPREITESFRLERVLKSSRSAIVLRATDPASGATVVIKLIPPAPSAALALGRERFLAAMAALRGAAGDAFPRLLDHGFTPDGSAFMVMEFVEGERLDGLIGAAPARILGLTSEIAAELEALARAGTAHGNLGLDNVLARRRDGVEHVCLLGFGTAAFHAGAAATTSSGAAGAAALRADLRALAAACSTLLRVDVSDSEPPRVTVPAVVAQRLQNPALLAATLEQALNLAAPLALDEFRRALGLALAGAPPTARAPAPASHDAAEAPGPVVAPEPVDPGEDTAPARVLPLASPPPPELSASAGPPAPPPGDDDVTQASAPAPAPAAIAPATASPAAPPAAAPVPPAQRKPRRRLYLAGGIAAITVAVVALAVWFARPRTAGPLRAPATPVPSRPTSPPPTPPAASSEIHLQRAEAALALGDLGAAGAELDAIAANEAAGLTPALQQRFRELRTSYLAARQHAVTREMRAAIAAGDVAALGRVVRGLPHTEEAAFPRDGDLLATIGDARRALEVHAALLQAERRAAYTDMLQDASVLLGLVPRCAQAVQLRERAAAALEHDAGTLAAAGDYDRALARLATVRQSWPTRPGLAERIASVTADQAVEQRFAQVMAKVAQTERDRAPEDGLALLASLPAEPRTATRVQEARTRLQAELAKLDTAPPTVTLVEAGKLEYKKGAAATIEVRIEDDHRVAGARLFARVEGSGAFVELPLRRGSGNVWSAEISPEFHNNHTVEFYVTASDYSGHIGRLGSPDKPLLLKRKRNWLGF